MTGLSEHRSISAALLRIVTSAVIVLVLLACDNGQPDTLADNGEVMLTLRISLPTATDGSTATRAITSNEENAIDIAQLKVLVFKASGSTETFSYEAASAVTGRQVYGNSETKPGRREIQACSHC